MGDNTFSNPSQLRCGVPQNSIFRAILCTLFTAPLGEVFRKHGINFQSYANGQHNYLSFKPNNTKALAKFKKSLEAVSQMHENV